MKKFIIIYTIISVVLFSIVVLVSLQLQTRSRIITVFNDIAADAHENHDFDTFVGYQTKAYQKIATLDLDDTDVYIYLAIGEQDESLINQVVVIVDNDGSHTYASDINDTDDQTNIVIVDEPSSTVVFSLSDEATNQEALSYGMHIYGFYYGAMTLEESSSLYIELYDYDGNLFYRDLYDVDFVDDFNTDGVELGLTDDEVDALIQRNETVTPEVIKDVTYFLVADIILGGVIAFILKRKKHGA